jgi:hypothetical protein
MSNLWINWRFGAWHLQIGPDRPFIAIAFNPYHYKNPESPWFERY